jgi:hypothetical protein
MVGQRNRHDARWTFNQDPVSFNRHAIKAARSGNAIFVALLWDSAQAKKDETPGPLEEASFLVEWKTFGKCLSPNPRFIFVGESLLEAITF